MSMDNDICCRILGVAFIVYMELTLLRGPVTLSRSTCLRKWTDADNCYLSFYNAVNDVRARVRDSFFGTYFPRKGHFFLFMKYDFTSLGFETCRLAIIA